MMWDKALEGIRAAIAAFPPLADMYGANVRQASTSNMPFDPKVPTLEYTVITDTVTEQWEPMIVQFDIWGRTVEQMIEGERALRNLFTPILPREFGGVFMLSEVIDAAHLSVPDRAGYYGRGLRIRFAPLREHYQPTA